MWVYWFNYVIIDFRHQNGISITEAQTSLLVKRPKWRGARRDSCFDRQLFGMLSPPPFISYYEFGVETGSKTTSQKSPAISTEQWTQPQVQQI